MWWGGREGGLTGRLEKSSGIFAFQSKTENPFDIMHWRMGRVFVLPANSGVSSASWLLLPTLCSRPQSPPLELRLIFPLLSLITILVYVPTESATFPQAACNFSWALRPFMDPVWWLSDCKSCHYPALQCACWLPDLRDRILGSSKWLRRAAWPKALRAFSEYAKGVTKFKPTEVSGSHSYLCYLFKIIMSLLQCTCSV